MALVHSLWTAPMLNNERGQASNKQILSAIWCYASSVAYARKNNAEIHLYADDYARELLGFLPYDNIYPLEVPEWIPTDFWAAGKFSALQKMSLGDIHIDGDVFIKTSKLCDILENSIDSADLIVQSQENSWVYENEFYINCLRIIRDYNIDVNGLPEYSPAWNCGLVCFCNEELKQKYINHYYSCVQRVSETSGALEKIRENKETWLDLLFEQQHLYTLSQDYKVCNLLGVGKAVSINAYRLGYQHLIGPEKWIYINKTKNQLYNLDKDIYNNVINQLNKMEIDI